MIERAVLRSFCRGLIVAGTIALALVATSVVVLGITAVALNATTAVETLVVLGALAALMGLLQRSRPGLRRLEAISLAAQHTDAGNLEVAIDLLEAVARPRDSIGEMAEVCLAVAYLRTSNAQRAARRLSDMLARHPSDSCRAVSEAKLALAYCLAVSGDLKAAERLYLSVPGIQWSHGPLQSLLLCRQGAFARAAASARLPLPSPSSPPRRGARVDCDLGDHGERVAALLSALAVTRANASRDAQLVRRLLAAARPAFAGEYRYLQADWPELQRFSREHATALTPAATAPASLDIPRARALGRGEFSPDRDAPPPSWPHRRWAGDTQ